MTAPYAIRIDSGGPELIERAATQSFGIKVYDRSSGAGAA